MWLSRPKGVDPDLRSLQYVLVPNATPLFILKKLYNHWTWEIAWIGPDIFKYIAIFWRLKYSRQSFSSKSRSSSQSPTRSPVPKFKSTSPGIPSLVQTFPSSPSPDWTACWFQTLPWGKSHHHLTLCSTTSGRYQRTSIRKIHQASNRLFQGWPKAEHALCKHDASSDGVAHAWPGNLYYRLLGCLVQLQGFIAICVLALCGYCSYKLSRTSAPLMQALLQALMQALMQARFWMQWQFCVVAVIHALLDHLACACLHVYAQHNTDIRGKIWWCFLLMVWGTCHSACILNNTVMLCYLAMQSKLS